MLVYPNYAKKYASTIEKSLGLGSGFGLRFGIKVCDPYLEFTFGIQVRD